MSQNNRPAEGRGEGTTPGRLRVRAATVRIEPRAALERPGDLPRGKPADARSSPSIVAEFSDLGRPFAAGCVKFGKLAKCADWGNCAQPHPDPLTEQQPLRGSMLRPRSRLAAPGLPELPGPRRVRDRAARERSLNRAGERL
jgi:hypothetical protein